MTTNLLIIRHAHAQKLEDCNIPMDDFHRPLSDLGVINFVESMEGLKTLFPQVDTILTSPLVRCAETAKIVKENYHNNIDIISSEEFSTECDVLDSINWLNKNYAHKNIILVGHGSQLRQLISYLICGSLDLQKNLKLKKGGAYYLKFDDQIMPSSALLRSAIQPFELTRLVQ